MEKIALDVVALTDSESHPGNFALILEERSGGRRLPIVIGKAEAQAIAMALENMQPQRPLTHDLFKQTLEALQATLEEVFIYKMEETIFYANLQLKNSSGQVLTIEARSSDAVALSVRFACPIYTTSEVLDIAGFTNESSTVVSKKGPFSDYPLKELETLLAKLLAKEDYQSAARIRDVIEKKKNRKSP
ncbi:bifunctional nuclease family protein [Tunicatimonas pelagia]|uniref:bifunctional nuclease family protein n=1 Tax=Tunicatimonas pelagia TaxID=931531 RepID=UPI0026669A1F|nr:bifunctional nuclease family protein [Tunicatimonas pelagia]WKN41336.1 bifunctional nuclease family protein [Tunicatimonas pelagia]